MNKRKPMPLQNLPDGSPFLLRSLSEDFVYMYLVRAGDCTCKVQGFKLTEAGNYCGFSDSFSPSTEVYNDTSRAILPVNKHGSLSIPKEFDPSQDKPKKMKTVDKNSPKNSVGRPKKHRVALPIGVEMTVGQMANHLGVEKFVVNNELARIKKETPNKIQVVGSVTNTKKGKPAKVFKLSI
jgi:hypothetical protein